MPCFKFKFNKIPISHLEAETPFGLVYLRTVIIILITFFLLADIMDDHLLNATYYSPELEEPLESTAMLGNIQHSDSPNHVETAASVGKSTVYLCTQSHYLYFREVTR